MASYVQSNSGSLSIRSSASHSEGDYEDDSDSSHIAASRIRERSRIEGAQSLRQHNLASDSSAQATSASHGTRHLHLQSEGSISDRDSTASHTNPPGPNISSAAFDSGGASGSIQRISSATKLVDSPVEANESKVELRRLQKSVPSNPSAFRRLPTHLDFPPSIDLEVIKPVAEDQIEFIVLMLQDHGVAERSLEHLARMLQRQYPEIAYILVRCPKSETNLGWAASPRDCDFVATSRMVLVDIVTNSLIAKCGFKTRQIAILGHGQGGTAALTAALFWDTIQFAGVISIGGAMPAHSCPPASVKTQTPALLLASPNQSNNSSVLQTAKENFIHASQSIRADMQELALESPCTLRTLLKPVIEFFAHRLRREEWTKQAVVSFDGGGIRGYGSLLIVRELMNKIGDEERRTNLEGGPAHSSFSPGLFRPTRAGLEAKAPISPVSHHSTGGSESSMTTPIVASPSRNLPNSSLFYPCHYFTYATGTSTGGLLSIMLSRLRMSVDECIEEYKSLGQKVFGHPRPLCKAGFPWHKFDYKALEDVVRGVTARYNEESEFETGFPSEEDLCRTIVLAYANNRESADVPYLFRTYGTPPPLQDRSRSIHRQRTARNQGPAPRLPIWQIARATSAAPGYFPPIRIPKGTGQNPNEVVLFKDGGFGTNNPSKEALECVVHKHGGLLARNIGPFVSIGTGAHDVAIFAKKPGNWQNFKANLKGAVAHPAKTKGAHEDMAYIANHDGQEIFPYYRFEGGKHLGQIALDEWKSNRLAAIRGKDSTPGYKTIDTMDQATSVYLLNRDVQDDLKELARILVKRRRLRTRDASAWDRYASASYYECTHGGCERTRISTSELYQDHLGEKHGVPLDEKVLERDLQASRRCWLYDHSNPGDTVPASMKGKSQGPEPPNEMAGGS